MSEEIAVIAGAAIAGTVGLFVVLLQHWLQRRHDRHREATERLAAFSAAVWTVTVELGHLATTPMDRKSEVTREVDKHADRVNSALARIQLVDKDDVYRTAIALDRALVELRDRAREKQWSRDEWRANRAGLSTAVKEYQKAARKNLGASYLEPDVT